MQTILIRRKHQRGFALVAAIFIVVVLSMLGIMMVTISGMERATASTAAQGARAFYAARSGIEWGIFQAVPPSPAVSSCVASTTFALTAPGLNGFTVTVQCTSTAHRERSAPNYSVFVITSTATSGNFADADYVSRTLQTSVTDAPAP